TKDAFIESILVIDSMNASFVFGLATTMRSRVTKICVVWVGGGAKSIDVTRTLTSYSSRPFTYCGGFSSHRHTWCTGFTPSVNCCITCVWLLAGNDTNPALLTVYATGGLNSTGAVKVSFSGVINVNSGDPQLRPLPSTITPIR